MEKTVDELKGVMECRKKEFGEEGKLLALCLSSRRNLCIHETVSKLDSREAVDAGCRERTSSWLRQEEEVPIEELDRQGKRCRFYENTSKTTQMEGVFTLEDLKHKGRREGVCPYFLAREFLLKAHVVVFNYSYMLDPKVANLVSSSLPPECIVVFDECHNIDNPCIESMSLNINRKLLDQAGAKLSELD